MATTRFSLANLNDSGGGKAAMLVGDKYYPLSVTEEASFQDATVKSLLQEWSTSFSLQSLAYKISTDERSSEIAIDPKEVDFLTPVMYPDN